jgi:Mg-chelatase subunit ChlD
MKFKSIPIIVLVLLALLLLVTRSARSQGFGPDQSQPSTQSPNHIGAPTALLKAENIICEGWERDTVIIAWTDKSTGEDGYKVERSDDGGAFSVIATVAPDAEGNYGGYLNIGVDVGDQGHRYRVRAYQGASFGQYSDVCNNRRIWDPQNFRIFYGLRGGTDDCPQVNGKDVCLANDSGSSSGNKYVDLQYTALQGSADAFFRLGFVHRADEPFGSLDKIPINVVWCDSGGCAGGGGLGLSPVLMETPFNLTTRAGDPVAYMVNIHELWHFLQGKYYWLNDPNDRWIIEGQARSIQDKICIGGDRPSALCFDDIATGYAGYVPEVNGYLSKPNRPIVDTSYQGVLFWTYLIEKYGTSAPTDQVEQGIDMLLNFWVASEDNPGLDGISTLNKALQAMGYSARFRDIFKDFAVANYAKNFIGPAKYMYADMAQTGGNYNQVALRVDQSLALGDTYLDTDETVYNWAGNYYQFRPSSDVPFISIKVTQDSTSNLYYKVLGIQGNNIVYEYESESRHLNLPLLNNSYDKVAVIVTGLENLGNYRISVNGTQPTLNILRPTNGNKAHAGNMASPDKFLAQVEILDGDGVPMAGVNLTNFSFALGEPASETPIPPANILTSAAVMGQQWFVIRAPGGLSPDPDGTPNTYRLTVRYGSALSDNEDDAVDYTPRTNADSVIVLDRSGSMADFNKLHNAGNAAKLFIDSWRGGDKFGLITFNNTVSVNMNVIDWNDDPGGSREIAFDIIDGLFASGETRIGDSIIAGYNNLVANGNSSHDWALVLLSDGLETAPGTRTFDQAVQDIVDATGKTPVIHTVALGPDADRPRMQAAASSTGGTYQYVTAPAKVVTASGITDISDMSLTMDYRYRNIATDILGQQQFFAVSAMPTDYEDTITVTVEGGAAELVLSLSWEPSTGYIAPPYVTLLKPDGTFELPFAIDSRHLVWRVSSPQGGDWILYIPAFGQLLQNNEPSQGYLVHYLVQASIKADVTMDAYITTPVEERVPGHPINVVGSLTDDAPITPGAPALMAALVEKPSGGLISFWMYDDGNHEDGAANDGIYGGTFYATGENGSYNITVYAYGYSSSIGEYFNRQKVLSFHVALVDENGNELPYADTDGDGLPDAWEIFFQPYTNPNVYDRNADPDNDGSSNWKEWQDGTDPSDPDSDDDGNSDGTDPNPFEPNLPPVIEPPSAHAFPGNGEVFIRYTSTPSYLFVGLFRDEDDDMDNFYTFIGQQITPGLAGVFTDTTVINGHTYCYIVEAIDNSGNRSAPSAPTCTMPNIDPIAPHGSVLINDGASYTYNLNVTLKLWASDNIDPAVRGFGPQYLPPADSATKVTQMLISNNPDFQGAAWEPYGTSKHWTLVQTYGLASVYVKYMDAVGNVSDTYVATIWVGRNPSVVPLLLPLVFR